MTTFNQSVLFKNRYVYKSQCIILKCSLVYFFQRCVFVFFFFLTTLTYYGNRTFFMFFGMGNHLWGNVLNANLWSHLLLNSLGLSFQDFYQQCREAFLVNSDLTLRAQLTEFRDHKLIRTKKVRPLLQIIYQEYFISCLLKDKHAFESTFGNKWRFSDGSQGSI